MNKQDIFRLVVQHSCEVIPEMEEQSITPNHSLVELGANSVDRAEIVMMTMEALNLQIPRVELFGVKNIGQLVEVIYEKLQAR